MKTKSTESSSVRKPTDTAGISHVIAEISASLVGHFSLPSLLDHVVITTMATLNAEVCSVFLEDKDNSPGVLVMMAGSGFARRLVGKASYKIGEGFTGTVAKYGAKFNIRSRDELENLEIDGRKVWRGMFDYQQWPSGSNEFRNCIAIPVRIKDQILGVIKVENKISGDYFDENDELYLETIANIIAVAIENVRLRDQNERQLKTIAAKAAHRIHNQIASYDGIEYLLSKQAMSHIPDKTALVELVSRLSVTTRNLKRMIGELKTYGKPMLLRRELCNINRILTDEAWLAKPPSRIEIELHLDNTIPLALVDPARFAEAIKELLRNSTKAIELSKREKGKILIVSKLAEHTDVATQLKAPFKSIVIDITDNGPGFPAGIPTFEPFSTTDPTSTGLGLATVKELIEAHGGLVTASNVADGGAQISISLPVTEN